MGRAKAILQSEFPYNISARCINKEWFQIPMDVVWEIFCEELNRTHKEYEMQIHSFVLMSNHFHLIATTPMANVSQCMHQFMHRTSRRLTREGNRINETYAGRHFKCILQHNNYYLNAYKYNYRNPVAAGLCESAENYKYSTLQGLISPAKQKIKIIEDSTFLTNPEGTLEWINTSPRQELVEGFKFGLKHQFFKSKKTSDNKPMITEFDIL